MTIPTASNYPEILDTDQNLYETHDSLRVLLSEDYTPGDTTIIVEGDEETMRRFPATGIITLTEQCSEPELRAVSFYYGARTLTTFEQLELLDGFTDVAKSKRITNVTQNVMARHHNSLKDAVIAVEEFVGIKGKVGQRPLEGTMEERINFLRKLVLVPRAWFSADKTIGLVPLSVTFKDLSFRLGTDGTTGEITYIWDFGDNTNVSSVITISATDEVPDIPNIIVKDLDGGTIEKVYTTPGIYDVSLTVKNDFGEDSVVFPDLINARVAAPDEAVIKFISRPGQIHQPGTPSDGPYASIPTLRSPTNALIDLQIQSGTNPNTSRSYGGEELDGGGSPIDPIMEYTWSLADDLVHNNSSTARASYSVGGIYDIILRVDTKVGAYRITTYEDAIDIVEKENMWLWNIANNDIQSNEFGLISETFKTANSVQTISKNSSFLDGVANEIQQKAEFERNNGFSPRGTSSSGESGVGLLYWASGRDDADSPITETIEFLEFNGFEETYVTRSSIARPWNWLSLPAPSSAYFLFGSTTTTPAVDTSPTNQEMQKLDLATLATSNSNLTGNSYKNGANELEKNIAIYDSGVPTYGHMSVYRTTWKDSTGYILRNDGVGDFFRIKSFYKTSGNASEPVQTIKKLTDIAGPTKTEGQLVTLSSGVFFFNNSGAISAYNDSSGTWETGGAGVNSAAFRSLQDSNVVGFDNNSNTLLATSDGNRRAYLSYDYSDTAFIKFDETDLTFSSLLQRPAGTQWQMEVF